MCRRRATDATATEATTRNHHSSKRKSGKFLTDRFFGIDRSPNMSDAKEVEPTPVAVTTTTAEVAPVSALPSSQGFKYGTVPVCTHVH